MQIRSRRWSSALLLLALGTVLVLYFPSLANYAGLARRAFAFPYSIDYGEGPLLDQVLRLASAQGIYDNDFAAPPYTISNYPPVFLLVQVPFAWIFGPAFWYGRAISLVSALLAALFIGLTLHALTRDRLAALVGGLLLLAYPYIQFWSLLNRIDLLALALSWAGIYTAVVWGERRWGIPFAAGLLIAAIFTRQSYALAAPLSIFVWLLAMRRPRQAFRLALIVGIASLTLFLLLTLVTWGGFYMNIVLANVNPFSWQTVKDYANQFYQNSTILLAVAGLYLLLERWSERTRAWPLALAYGFGAAAAAITVGKDGSNVNYMLEVAAALCFAAGAGFAWLGRGVWLRLALLVALMFQLPILQNWALRDFNGRLTEKTSQEPAMFRLAQVVREADGIVLIGEEMGLVPLAEKRLYFQPFEYKMLAGGGLWDEEPFVRSIRAQEFSLIVLYDSPYWPSLVSRWTPRALSAIRSSYRLDGTIGFNRIYRPKP